jgi:hypothetical protein
MFPAESHVFSRSLVYAHYLQILQSQNFIFYWATSFEAFAGASTLCGDCSRAFINAPATSPKHAPKAGVYIALSKASHCLLCG